MLLVVGGQASKVGKTSVVEGLIRSLPGCHWTALKISGHSHGGRGPCELTEEREAGPGDSGRYLAAGARRSFWLRAAPGELRAALPALREILAAGPHTVIESNSILEFLRPDLFLFVLDTARGDLKHSALRFIGRADALVVIERGDGLPAWTGIPQESWDAKPRFAARPPDYVPAALSAYVRERLAG